MTTQTYPTLDAAIEAQLVALVNCRTEDQEFYTDEQEAAAFAFIDQHRAVIKAAMVEENRQWLEENDALDEFEPDMYSGYPVRDLFQALVNTLID